MNLNRRLQITFRKEKFLPTTWAEFVFISESNQGTMAWRCHPTYHVCAEALGLGGRGGHWVRAALMLGDEKWDLPFGIVFEVFYFKKIIINYRLIFAYKFNFLSE